MGAVGELEGSLLYRNLPAGAHGWLAGLKAGHRNGILPVELGHILGLLMFV